MLFSKPGKDLALRGMLLVLPALALLPPRAASQEPHPEVVAKLHTLHAAFEKYRRDHDGCYPPRAVKNEGGGLTLWPELLKPYLNDNSPRGRVDVNGPFFAPYVPLAERRGGRASIVSFGYNRFGLGANAPDFKRGRRLVRVVPHPARTLLLVECEAPKQPGIGWYDAYPGLDFNRYRGRAHVLFCDGHVELRSPEELNVEEKADTALAPWFGDLSKQAFQNKPDAMRRPDEKAVRPKPAASRTGGVDADLPLLTVARMSRSPVMDGTVSAGEWDEGSAFAGYKNYVTRMLDPFDVTTLCGYDDKKLYFAFIVPLPPGAKPNARAARRDGQVYRDDAVEIFLLPDAGGDLRQIIVNAAGTVFDRRGADTSWNGLWDVATGQGAATDLPEVLRFRHSWWCIEIALPFSELGVKPPAAGDLWRVNFCLDGSRPMVFAPTYDGYADSARFAYLAFLGADQPSLSLATLGRPTYGRPELAGWARNPSPQPAVIHFRVRAEKAGTQVLERTGFDEIAGALVEFQESVSLAARARQTFSAVRTLDDPQIDRLRIEAVVALAGGETIPLHRNGAALSILPPLRLVIRNYPTNEYFIGTIDTTGLSGAIDGARAVWRVVCEEGETDIRGRLPLTSRNLDLQVDYSPLTPGKYTWTVDIERGGVTLASRRMPFERVKNPAWFRNDFGKAPIVLPPFTPIEYGEREVRVWGRRMAWSDASLLPSVVYSGGNDLLAGPIRLSLTMGGKTHTATLERFDFSSREQHRAEMTLLGKAGPFDVHCSAWAEYDGLLWVDVALRARGTPLAVDTCRIEIPLRRDGDMYYHGVTDRSMTGRADVGKREFPFQYYFWVGSCERGIGFVTESTKGMAPGRDGCVYRLLPGPDSLLFQVNLIESPVSRGELSWSFGLQATPVRPLPPDYHSWFTANYERSNALVREFGANMDFATLWPFRWPEGKRWVNAFCDMMGVDAERLKPLVAEIHAEGTPVIIYHAPMNFTDGARPEHDTYACEWMTEPRARWKAYDFVQTRACARSSYTDWQLYGLRKTLRETGIDGFYFDGASSGPCTNRHHGCGWVDEKGKVHPTWPVLANREFNRRVMTILYEEVEKRKVRSPAAAARPDWPGYYNMIHISGAVCPPQFAFNTCYFCGEWFKGRIKQGKGYEELLTLHTFRPRYLSQPWGVPNFFLPITRESVAGATETSQTECILAYMLPHGVPLFARYLSRAVRGPVMRAMIDFNTRAAEFTPCFRANENLRLDAGHNRNVLLATWEREGRILLVVSNVGASPEKVTLSGTALRGARARTIFPADEIGQPEAGRLSFIVGSHTFRMLLLE